MLDIALRKYGRKIRLTVKSAVAALLVALAVGLPQIVHALGGAAAGAAWLPMYAPALLAGCLLGWQWGIGVGILSPLVSFGLTSLFAGSPMPSVTRLPYMTAELAAFGGICGAFSKSIQKNAWLAFPAVLSAQIAGRTLYVLCGAIAGNAFSSLWAVVRTGLSGLYLQALIVPLAAVALSKVLRREHADE